MPRAQIIGGFFAASFLLSPAVASAALDTSTSPLITAQKPFVAIKKTNNTDEGSASSATPDDTKMEDAKTGDAKASNDDDDDDDDDAQDCSGDISLDIGDNPLGNGANNSASMDCTKGPWAMEIGAKVFAMNGSPSNNNVPIPSNNNSFNAISPYSGTNLTVSLAYTTKGSRFKIGAFNPDWDPQPNSSLPDYYVNAITAPLAAFSWVNVEGIHVTQTFKSGSATTTGTAVIGKELNDPTSGVAQGMDYAFSLGEQKGEWNLGVYAYRRATNTDNAPERLVNFTLGYTHHKGRDIVQVRIDGGIDKNADGEARKYTYTLTSLTDTHSINHAFSVYAAVIAGKGTRTDFMFNLAGGLKYSPTGNSDQSFTLGLTRGVAQKTIQLSINLHIAG